MVFYFQSVAQHYNFAKATDTSLSNDLNAFLSTDYRAQITHKPVTYGSKFQLLFTESATIMRFLLATNNTNLISCLIYVLEGN